MTERLLITGGSGFIGSEVVRLALEQGFELRNLDLKPPREPGSRAHWRAVDIRERDTLLREVEAFSPHRLLHLASDIDITIDRIEDFRSTIDGTANVLDALKRAPELKSFVHTSTMMVMPPGGVPTGERHVEPYTLYGEAKAVTEELVWNAALDVPWYILRPVIIWGPHHPSFATQIFRHIGTRRYLHPKGREPIVRAYGYVTNVASQMLAFAMLAPQATEGHVFYLGDGSIDYDIWADAFSSALTGKPARRVPVWLLDLLGRAGDMAKKVGIPSPIDSGRAFRMSTSNVVDFSGTHELAGPPPVAFEEGVARTVDWLRASR